MKRHFKTELSNVYTQLFKEIEIFKNKIRDIRLNSKNFPRLVKNKTNSLELLVSVVTPAYNAEKFLPNLYMSLKNQSIARFIEWVIVDDCSTDNSLEFYEQLSNDNSLGKINVFRNNKNLGAAMSLKVGFSLATSNILAWVSADDFYVSEDKLEKDLQLINDGFDIVFSRYSLFGIDPKNSKQKRVPLKKYYNKYQMIADLFLDNYLNGSSVCMKKEVYIEIGGINEFLINVDGDLDLWTRSVLMNKKIGFSNTIVFNCQHSGQTSRAFEKMIVGENIVRLSYVRFLKQFLDQRIVRKNFSYANQYRHVQEFLKDSLVFILLYSKLIDVNTKLIQKTKNYFKSRFFSRAIWLEEVYDKPLHYTKWLRSNYGDLLQAQELFKSRIYELSDEFMKTEVFKIFANRYKEVKEEST